MEEKQIFKMSLIMALIGLISLFFYSDNFNLRPIEEFEFDQEVKLQGLITKKITANNTIILEIEGEKIEKNTVIFFPDTDIDLEENDYVEVIGMVTQYKGKEEIIADQVKLVG